jgi:transcriptional regulator with XRE-family HTH domain
MEIVRTVEEWEAEIGVQIRTVRMLAGISQTDLAKRANVAVGALAGLENGRGSTLKTLVALVRSLDRTEWLEQLSPLITISPMQMLRDQQRQKPRQRVYAPRPRPRSGQGSGADLGADLGPAQKGQSTPRSRN